MLRGVGGWVRWEWGCEYAHMSAHLYDFPIISQKCCKHDIGSLQSP